MSSPPQTPFKNEFIADSKAAFLILTPDIAHTIKRKKSESGEQRYLSMPAEASVSFMELGTRPQQGSTVSSDNSDVYQGGSRL